MLRRRDQVLHRFSQQLIRLWGSPWTFSRFAKRSFPTTGGTSFCEDSDGLCGIAEAYLTQRGTTGREKAIGARNGCGGQSMPSTRPGHCQEAFVQPGGALAAGFGEAPAAAAWALDKGRRPAIPFASLP